MKRAGIGIVILCFLLILFKCPSLYASGGYESLIARGIERVNAGDYEKAIEYLE